MKTAKLGEICKKIGSGATPRGGSEVYLSNGIALIRSQNVYNEGFKKDGLAYIGENHAQELESVTVQAADVLLNITGDSVARVCQVTKDVLPARVNQHVAIIRPHKDILDARYLRYFLITQSMQHYMHALAAAGATRQALTKRMIESFEVPLPPLPEQHAIAHILGSLDDKIELNRRMNETLEAMAQAVFKSWFVDFDPVRAKAEGRDTGLPKEIADLFPDSFEDSDLGEIPKGWKVGCVDDEFDLTMGQSPPGETYNETGDGMPFYQGRSDFAFRFPTRRVYCTAPTRLAKARDTLISVRAPVGDINMASEDCAIGRGVAAARHKTGSRSYTYQFMRSLDEVFARFEAEGTVFGSIGKKDFHAITCVIPSHDIVEAYEHRVFPLDSSIEVNERESRTLAAIRDALLPKLISGELRVKNAERYA